MIRIGKGGLLSAPLGLRPVRFCSGWLITLFNGVYFNESNQGYDGCRVDADGGSGACIERL